MTDTGSTLVAEDFFRRPAVVVARALLGHVLVHDAPEGRSSGVIVETEAYDQTDAASHCFSGPTPRNRVMFGHGGRAYVYRSYGIHWCMNVTCGEDGFGAAVLLRALQPLDGIPLMEQRRAGPRGAPPHRDLARGPGRLAQAMGLTDAHYGLPLDGSPLWVARPADAEPATIHVSTRIGITKDVERLWRFNVAGSPFVSGPKRNNGTAPDS